MQAHRVKEQRQMILVLGMHRSGTSAVTGVLAQLGAELGGHLIPATKDNPKGFFEHADIFAVHQELLQELGSDWDDTAPLPEDWLTSPAACLAAAKIRKILHRDFAETRLAVVKDPRLCRLVPLWRAALAHEGFRLKVVLVVREGLEVVASLVKRDALRPAEAASMWLRHELESEAATRGDPRVVVAYAAMLRNWRAEVQRIAAALGVQWPHALDEAGTAIDDFLDSGLRHHRRDVDTAFGERLASPLGDWLGEVHAALTHPGGIDTTRLDEITRTLARMDRDSIFYQAPLQRLRKEVQRWRPEAEKVWENHEWLRARVEELEAAAADRKAGLAALREGLAEGLGQVREAIARQQEAGRMLGEHWRAELDAQRGQFAHDLEALREEASLTHAECETLRKAVLESQHRVETLQASIRSLYGRRLSLKERMTGRLAGNGTD